MSIDDVQDISPRVQYVALAAQTEFDYPFPIFQDADLVVDVDGVTQTLTTHYAVTGEGEDTGGEVTFVTPMTGGEIVTIYRDIAIERTTDFQQNGPLASTSFNDELDRITLILQQLESRIGRALRLPITGSASSSQIELSPIANWLGKYITVNANGIPEPANLVAGTISQSVIGGLLYPQTAAELAAGVTPSSLAAPVFNVLRYGADPTGVLNSSSAFNSAIAAAVENGRGLIVAPYGTYLLNSEVTVDGDDILIDLQSSKLLAGANSMTVVRIAGSRCGLINGMIDGNSFTSVVGLKLAPEDEAQTTELTQTNFNTVRDLTIQNCAEGLYMRCGPDVAAADSGCWYNRFYNLHVKSCTRGVYLKSGTNSGSSGVNRNTFVGLRVGESGSNTGIHIESGDSNMFYGTALEGILGGTSPLATPTAIRIDNTDTHATYTNNYNMFFGVYPEACTRELDLHNAQTQFFSAFFTAAKLSLTAAPQVMLGGYAASQTPQTFPGLTFQQGSQIAAIPNGVAYLPGGAAADTGAKLGFADDLTSGLSRPATSQLMMGILGGGVQDWFDKCSRFRGQTAASSSGGSLTNFDFPHAYSAGGIYLVVRGARDATGADCGHRVSVFYETVSGTFGEGTKILDVVAADTTFGTDTVSRSGGNLRVAVQVNKTGITFTNYAQVLRIN